MAAFDKIIEDSYAFLKSRWWGLPVLALGGIGALAFSIWNSLPNGFKERLLLSPSPTVAAASSSSAASLPPVPAPQSTPAVAPAPPPATHPEAQASPSPPVASARPQQKPVQEMGGARKRQESRPDFTSPRKIYVNYQFRGSCPIFLSLKVYPSDNWVRLTYASRSGTGGFYADYRKDNDLWRTTAPYVYIMAQPISQDELTSVAERLRATNGLEPYKVWLTPNDEGGAFTPTIKCE